MTEVSAPRLRRIFLAFAPDAAIRERLELLGARCQEYAGGRLIAAGKLHLTLFFLGQARDAQVQAIAGLAQARPAPTVLLMLDRLGYWERGGIVWAGSHECPTALLDWIADLHERARHLGFAVERRAFAPHVTLLRNARRRPRAGFETIPWQLDRLRLYESRLSETGSEYEVLHVWQTAAIGDVK